MAKLSQSKKIFELTLLILAAGSIYPLVYLRQNFETTILEVFAIVPEQLSNYYSILGVIFVIGYIPSGWLADRFPVKWLIIFSLLLTAATGVYYAQIPDSSMLLPIFLIWGVSTVFTFWSAILKTVHILADAHEEGKFFGALDGGRGLVEALLATAAVTIFASIAGHKGATLAETTAGFQAVVYMYCGMIVVVAIGLLFLMPNHKEEQKIASENKNAEGEMSTWRSIVNVLSLPEVWVMTAIIFCGYTLFWAHYYFSGYLDANHNATKVVAGYVTVAVLWMRPVGGFSGGFLADKFGRSRVIGASMAITSALVLSLGLLPSGTSLVLISGIAIAAGLLMYVIRGVYWSFLDDCRVPVPVAGVAIGVISFFGYLPDVLLPKISAVIYGAYGTDHVAEANNLYFIVTACIGVLGVVAAWYFTKLVKARTAREQLAAKEDQPTYA